MNALVLALLVVAQLSPAQAKQCSECASDYDTAKTGAATAAKCKAITDYLTCLSTATDCPLNKASADLIKTDHDAIINDCPLSDVCTCQKTFFQTDQKTGSTAQCGAVTTFYHCLTQANKTHKACDGTSTVSALAKAAERFIPQTCAAKTDTCDCQITYTKANISDDAKKCTAAKNFISCLVGQTKPGCDPSVTVKTLATGAKPITDPSSCSTSDVCDCEIDYAIADVSTTTSRCTSTTTFETCLNGIKTAKEVGCDGSTTTSSLTNDTRAIVEDVLCSTAGLEMKSSVVISLLSVMVAILFLSF